MPSLQLRDFYDDCYYSNGTRYCRNRSAWNDWVRWVVLVAVVVGFFLFFMTVACCLARKRRRAGKTPYYGTGWAARPNNTNAQPYYNNAYAQPAPPYSAQPQQNSYYGSPPAGANQGYYGQQNGVELQSPQPIYNRPGDQDVYNPPAGPPPAKH